MKLKKPARNIKKILIIFWGFIGEALLTFPLIEALHCLYPKAKISYILGKGYRSEVVGRILKSNRNVKECLPLSSSVLAKILKQGPYDLVIDLCENKITALIVKLSLAKFKVSGGFRGTPRDFSYAVLKDDKWYARIFSLKKLLFRDKGVYRANQFLEIADFLGGRKHFSAKTPEISLTQKEISFGSEFLKHMGAVNSPLIVGIHPGGANGHRLWHARNYAWLADRLIEGHNAKVVIFYGPYEKFFADMVCKYSKNRLYKVYQEDIRKYLAVVSQCNVFITTDGGPLHMALAVGVSCIGIFNYRYGINTTYWFNHRQNSNLESAVVQSDRINNKDRLRVLAKTKEAIRKTLA